MPYQPINYANIAPIGNPGMRDLVETLMKGYQAAQIPKNNSLEQALLEAHTQKAQQEANLQKQLSSYVNQGLEGPANQPANPLARALINKALGLPANYEPPEESSKRKIQEQSTIEQNKGSIKELQGLEKEIPLIEGRVRKAKELLPLIEKHPHYFGGIVPPSLKKPFITDEDYGTLETGLAELVAPFAQELSSKGLASALNYAIGVKPGFGENPQISVGKIKRIIKSYEDSVKEARKRKGELSGNSKAYNEDILHTAQKYNISPEEVVERLRNRNA